MGFQIVALPDQDWHAIIQAKRIVNVIDS